MWALLRFIQKCTWEKIKIRGGKTRTIYQKEGLSFSYAEAKEFGISTAQFHRILKLLVELGFLDPEHRGGAYGRDYSRYALSDRWRNYGQPDFEFKTLERVLRPGHDVQSRMAK
ncbi:hypothetical protein FAK_15000 [Desulfoferula mesophila]|uniref:Uncharacterized protein n=2 Tax=Desulfoferula mesophila TaxID=3058419 RepID=A0AAU9EIK5_9BACT|nr:hypothetical protein FAK_15000 [Desulfoferula mesophilus]